MLLEERYDLFQRLANLEEAVYNYIFFRDIAPLKQLMKDPAYDEVFTKRFAVSNKYELLDSVRMTDLARKGLMVPYESVVVRCKRREVNNLPCVYILYSLKGSFQCEVAGEKLELSEGCLCMCNAGVPNSFETADPDGLCITMALTKWYISSVLMQRMPHNSVFGNFFEHGVFNTGLAESYIYIDAKGSEKIRFFLSEALNTFLNTGFQEQEVMNAYIILFFDEFIKLYEKSTELSSNDGHVKAAEIINYIYENYTQATLSSVAAHFHFSNNYLSGIIKKLMGKNFTDLVHEIRMVNACQLLKDTTLPVNEIAQKVGYQNSNHFYRLFKQAHGCTPAEFRKKEKTALKKQKGGTASG